MLEYDILPFTGQQGGVGQSKESQNFTGKHLIFYSLYILFFLQQLTVKDYTTQLPINLLCVDRKSQIHESNYLSTRSIHPRVKAIMSIISIKS